MAWSAGPEAAATVLDLTVSDVKQFAYCPRIPYYRYVMPVGRAVTYKMEHGKTAHVDLELLERRRKLRAYGLHTGERRFGVWLVSSRLGLAGKLDLLIVTPRALYPVDFKDTEGPPRQNHLFQLAAYALLVEEEFGRPVDRGFIYLIPQKDIREFSLTEADKAEVLRMLGAIREAVERERLPEPTPVRSRCWDCEYQNYCADIW